MDQSTLAAYLDRIGVSQPQIVDATSLRDLHRAHQTAVPFENLSIHLSEPISLAEDDLLNKIVTRRRGGFCYELNGAFALLLEALGAQVTRVAARTTDSEGRLGPPFDHLALIVRTADGAGPWLADVGFGGHSTYPLLLDRRDSQDDPGGRFLLADTAERCPRTEPFLASANERTRGTAHAPDGAGRAGFPLSRPARRRPSRGTVRSRRAGSVTPAGIRPGLGGPMLAAITLVAAGRCRPSPDRVPEGASPDRDACGIVTGRLTSRGGHWLLPVLGAPP